MKTNCVTFLMFTGISCFCQVIPRLRCYITRHYLLPVKISNMWYQSIKHPERT
ncbi:hypothetical protein DM02DRAFT_341615 [Periconia macrospinosa]|uniref:Uncharacterized protein n=1 Tax=Periconia macrospinosa TaxID=97972 RepID=A0A2V1DWH7_9PLEO|nr:hypothetical protein DM02DRAFT_341615 [Periconia macrospinosa]